MKPRDSRPHAGTVMAEAMHTALTDRLIRERLRQMVSDQTIHLVYDKLNNPDASRLLSDILANVRPIPDPLRVLLATLFDIENPGGDAF